MNIWMVSGVISVILLIKYRGGKNAVWGGLTTGIAVGLVVAVIFAILGKGFNWGIIGKGAIVGSMIGFFAELLGMVSDIVKNRNNKK